MCQGLRLALFALLPLVAFVSGCGSEEGGKKEGIPLGEPSISIRSIGDVAAPKGTVEVVLGCDGRLSLTAEIAHFTLRPPDACFGYPQCGQLAVLVDPRGETPDAGPPEAAIIETSATPFVVLDFGALPEAEGSHLVRAELWRDGTSRAASTSDGKPLAKEITVSAKLPSDCDAATDGSDHLESDAGPDASGDASGHEDEDASFPGDAS